MALILKLLLSLQLRTCTESLDTGLTDCLILKPNERRLVGFSGYLYFQFFPEGMGYLLQGGELDILCMVLNP